MLVKFFLSNVSRTNCGQILIYLSRKTSQNQDDFLAFFLYLRKYAYISSNLLLKTVTWGLTIMEIPDEMLKEIRESGYDQELVFTQIRKLLESEKEYDV